MVLIHIGLVISSVVATHREYVVINSKPGNTNAEGTVRRYGMIVHEDPLTEQRGRNLWNRIARAMGEEIPFSVHSRSTTGIQMPPDFEPVEMTDIVIVSVHDLLHFILSAGGWLADWMTARSPLPRVLFILHDGKEDELLLSLLARASGLSGVTFIRCRCEPG